MAVSREGRRPHHDQAADRGFPLKVCSSTPQIYLSLCTTNNKNMCGIWRANNNVHRNGTRTSNLANGDYSYLEVTTPVRFLDVLRFLAVLRFLVLRFLVKALGISSESAKLDYRYTYANLNGMTVARIGIPVGATVVSIKHISNEL